MALAAIPRVGIFAILLIRYRAGAGNKEKTVYEAP